MTTVKRKAVSKKECEESVWMKHSGQGWSMDKIATWSS